MSKPSIILTSQFTAPSAKDFSNYVKYMTRKEALSEKKLTSDEEQELRKIKTGLERLEIGQGRVYSSLKNKKDLSGKEVEANEILDIYDYEKYIKYMSRQYALKRKKKLSKDEKKELKVVKEKLSNMNKCISKDEQEKTKNEDSIKPGVFSIDKEIITSEDMENIHEIVKKAQKNGSVFYQDVISFDMEFLIEEGLYNPQNDELDEENIQRASRKMMDKLFDDEKIKSGYWFASIHRNTEHIHIHYGTVELRNTRELIKVKEDGKEYIVPRGKRKQQTIDNMKSTFANSLIDRTSELSRITELRNTLVEDIKETYSKNKEELEQTKLLEEIYNELPTNKKYWQYGSKKVSNSTRKKIDRLTDLLMKDNENYKEYIEKTAKEGEYRKELFGDSKRSNRDYASNKVEEIYKRLGNSLLKEMKKNAYVVEKNRELYAEKAGYGVKYLCTKNKKMTKSNSYRNHKPIISRKNIYQIKRALNDNYDKYRAEKDYEYIQQKIAWQQENNTL